MLERGARRWVVGGRALHRTVVEKCHVPDSAGALARQPGTFGPSSATRHGLLDADVRSSDDGVLSAPGVERHRGLACIRGNSHTTIPTAPAFIMASTGEAVTYREYEARANRLAHLFREHRPATARPLLDLHGEQRSLPRVVRRRRTIRVCTTRASTRTSPPRNSPTSSTTASRRSLITSLAKRSTVLEAIAAQCPRSRTCSSSTTTARAATTVSATTSLALAGHPTSPIPDERVGHRDALLVGHDRSPEGHHPAACPISRPARCWRCSTFLHDLWHYREDMIYLSPAPLYHSAPQAAVGLTIRSGGTVDHHGALRSRRVPAASSSATR